MSAARDDLRLLDFPDPAYSSGFHSIVNGHDVIEWAKQAGYDGPDVYLSYRLQQTGRSYQSAAWQVVRPGFKTDPDGHWHNRGHKTFRVGGNRAAVLSEAQEWAGARYGVTAWAKIPGLPGYVFPKPLTDMARAAIRAAKRQAAAS